MKRFWQRDGKEVEHSSHETTFPQSNEHEVPDSLPESGDEADWEAELSETMDWLMRDKQEVEAHLQGALDQTNPEKLAELDAALKSGMEQGRRRAVRFQRKRLSMGMGAAVVCMLLMLTAFVRISPAFAAVMKEIPGFGGFVELIAFDPSLSAALSNEFIQPVNCSDEKNGYKFTVNGVMADSQRMVLFYTVEGPGIQKYDNTFRDYELKDENGEGIQAVISSYHYFREEKGDSDAVQDYLDIMMSPGVAIPKEIEFKMQVGQEWLKVQVPIDHERFANLEERIAINHKIEMGGQQIEIKEAVISPLQVSITFKGNENNTKRLNGFIDLELVDERGRRYTSNAGMGDLNSEITQRFQSSYFQKPKELTLKLSGIYMSDQGLTMSVNTETGETISAPDSRLILKGVYNRGKSKGIELELTLTDPSEYHWAPVLFEHNGTFRDGNGKQYPLPDGAYANMRIDSGGIIYYDFNVPDVPYVQPLTFNIRQYLGYVLQDIEVKIKQ
ncbi:DUF4179 domain-containing protein [Paenibacillus sp. GCM10027627]|uniref:DUF4179 domain-containing protein n=1 Tax=unclassified Paenibacillus TaxID=185978 RepID=UPI0036330BD5